ncbi:MAG: hypothetical protein FJ279_07275 [Planctomycetes bacterium]|nr:hypothetical protein [Planctomycetota bacterium]MBM4080085.1 hypothetical protein [Planctomycetota bacterium]
MISVVKATALGAIQGLTEFLPVSSSVRLVILKRFLGQKTPGADMAAIGWAGLAAGVLTSLAVGCLALRALIQAVQLGRFHHFTIYCWAFGALSLLFLTVRKGQP